MSKILNFLKALVFPSHMEKFKNMSAAFSLAILVLVCYLFTLPIGYFYSSNIDMYIEGDQDEAYSFVGASNETLTSEELDKLNQISDHLETVGLSYKNGKLSLPQSLIETTKGDYQHLYPTVTFTRNVGEGENARIDKYIIHLGIYFDCDTDGDGEDKAVAFSDSEMLKEFNAIPYVDGEKHFLMVLGENNFYYQVGQRFDTESDSYKALTDSQKEEVSKHYIVGVFYTQKLFFKDHSININNLYKNGFSMLRELGHVCSVNYSFTYYQMVTIQNVFGGCLLIPLLIILLCWILFKRNGKLKKFKEYLNIAAMSSIIPALSIFILSWFAVGLIQFYLYVYGVFYTIMLFKINSKKQIA